jgi:hypothetical protein
MRTVPEHDAPRVVPAVALPNTLLWPDVVRDETPVTPTVTLSAVGAAAAGSAAVVPATSSSPAIAHLLVAFLVCPPLDTWSGALCRPSYSLL